MTSNPMNLRIKYYGFPSKEVSCITSFLDTEIKNAILSLSHVFIQYITPDFISLIPSSHSLLVFKTHLKR